MKMQATHLFSGLLLCYFVSQYVSLPSLLTGLFTGNIFTLVVASIFLYELFKVLVKQYLKFDKHGMLLIEYLSKCIYAFVLTPPTTSQNDLTLNTLFSTLNRLRTNTTNINNVDFKPLIKYLSNKNLTTDKLKSLLKIIFDKDFTDKETKEIHIKLGQMFEASANDNVIYEFLCSLK